ncbi:MAG: hypothetical protein EHM14_10685 [Methanothrix sp.]|nr:MAG: hypothetical protein EHM14_10685 [Methanothrix sp.]
MATEVESAALKSIAAQLRTEADRVEARAQKIAVGGAGALKAAEGVVPAGCVLIYGQCIYLQPL